ncbi:MAG: hypothetical protein ACR2NM_04370 [Bythopirellula sp.]
MDARRTSRLAARDSQRNGARMFALHETTQRRVCRITFLLVCAVPTLLTLVAIAYCNRPWRQSDWQQTLAQHLHLRATLDDISRPRPGVTVLTEVHLSDLLNGELLGTIGRLELHKETARQMLRADHLQLQSAQLSALADAISSWFATGESFLLDFHADRLTIVGDSNAPLELHDLSIRSDSTSMERQRFRVMTRTSSDEIVELALDFDKNVLRCALDTQQGSLPAWLIGELVPGVGGCGDAEFTGALSVESSDRRLRGKLVGSFADVDLQAWIGANCPHDLHGTARVELEPCTWVEDRLELVRGKIEAGNGSIGYSLLLNAKDLCACVPGPSWQTLDNASSDQRIDFEELALSFEMSSAGIRIAGTCEQGGVVRAEGAPLLFAPPSESNQTVLPVGQLVQLLDYRRQPGWLPATRGAIDMAEKLPLPERQQRE